MRAKNPEPGPRRRSAAAWIGAIGSCAEGGLVFRVAVLLAASSAVRAIDPAILWWVPGTTPGFLLQVLGLGALVSRIAEHCAERLAPAPRFSIDRRAADAVRDLVLHLERLPVEQRIEVATAFADLGGAQDAFTLAFSSAFAQSDHGGVVTPPEL